MIDYSTELKTTSITRDTRGFSRKIRDFLGNGDNAVTAIAGMAMLSAFMPVFSEIAFIGALGAFAINRNVSKKEGLPMRMPKSSELIDPNELDVHGRPQKSEGIIYIGSDQKTNKEVWITDTQARTHMMFLGTTGSGKAQSLRSQILTPQGWTTMGRVQPGDKVCIPDGKTATVVSIHPQGFKRMFVFKLRDQRGQIRTAECCDEHLWATRVFATPLGEPTDGKYEEQVTVTTEVIELLKKGIRVMVPVVHTIEKDGAFSAGEQQWVDIQSVKKGSMQPAQCLRIDSRDHLYVTNNGVVTHNTEFLLSVVYNALIHASGFIYVDGKADSSLYRKIYSMARACGREDDVRVINFQTGARDIFGAQPFKMSNTMNPFAVGSSGMLSQMVMGLIASDKKDVWSERANSFVEALMKPLVFLRERYGWLLDVNLVRDFFELKKLEELVWKMPATHPGLDAQLEGLMSYLANLPTYDKAKYHKQSETANEQHGYITMQLVRTFNSLADTYGYIMRTPLAEIDFLDVFLNRRILVVLLPALEKSSAELSNLGRIIVAAIKATMAVGLGARIEGETEEIIDSKPTNASSPFMCVLDEYGYYAVEGFSVVPAQARSLGFSAIFAGQDLPAFEKASEKEAQSTLANTNTKFCGKLICTKTSDYFKSIAGQGWYSKTSGYDREAGAFGSKYMDMQSASLEKFDRVTFDDLTSQKSGAWHMFFADKILRIRSFYANPANIKTLRVNHFIRVKRPLKNEIDWYKGAQQKFLTANINDLIECPPIRDINLMKEGFDSAERMSSLKSGIAAVMYYCNHEQKSLTDFNKMMSESSEGEDDVMFGVDEDGVIHDIDEDDSEDLFEEIDPDDDSFGPFGSGDEFEVTDDDGVAHLYKMERPENAEISGINRMSIIGRDAEDDEFDDNQGLLNKERTESDIKRIERILGAGNREAGMMAVGTMEVLSNVTQYPLTAPNIDGNPEAAFADAAHELLSALDDIPQTEGD